MNISLRTEIVSLIEAPELKQYLLAQPEKLTIKNYAEIVYGAPVSLEKKRELLEKLQGELKSGDDFDYVQCCSSFLDGAINTLKNKDNVQMIFHISLVHYDENEEDAWLDGPFFAVSWEEAQNVIHKYLANDYGWCSAYWRIDLFSRNGEMENTGSFEISYGFIADTSGEVQYFSDFSGTKNMSQEWTLPRYAALFPPPPNLPVPYQPGDILQLDCSPYGSEKAFCLITKVGGGPYGCEVQCLYLGTNDKIWFGDLRAGAFYANHLGTGLYLSPLYRAKVYTGYMPGNCEFMVHLSEKLRKDPGFADMLWEVNQYLSFINK